MTKPKNFVVAIDGPTGVGKSTSAKKLAKKLGYLYIDTGAMYRAITFKALKEKIDLKNEKALLKLVKHTKILLKNTKVYLDGKNVTSHIRLPYISKNSFYIANSLTIRKHMVALQQKMGKKGKVILDGRDIGTKVFPYADIKFYLDADFSERVKRRYKELKEKRIKITLKEIAKDIKTLDFWDKKRKINPLKKAQDAITIDTTYMKQDEVIEFMLKKIQDKFHSS